MDAQFARVAGERRRKAAVSLRVIQKRTGSSGSRGRPQVLILPSRAAATGGAVCNGAGPFCEGSAKERGRRAGDLVRLVRDRDGSSRVPRGPGRSL